MVATAFQDAMASNDAIVAKTIRRRPCDVSVSARLGARGLGKSARLAALRGKHATA